MDTQNLKGRYNQRSVWEHQKGVVNIRNFKGRYNLKIGINIVNTHNLKGRYN